MKHKAQKTKREIKPGYLSAVIGLFAFAGLFLTSVILAADRGSPAPVIAISACTFVHALCLYYEFFRIRRTVRDLDDLAQIIKSMEERTGRSLGQGEEIDSIKALSDMLAQSLVSLDEKNLRLESEFRRNQRLSESISDFYRQIRILKDSGFRIDFFEYDYANHIFIFITGLLTLTDAGEDVLEITTDDLFSRFRLSVSAEDFKKNVERCVRENVPIDFEFSVDFESGKTRWLRFWGRLSADRTRITGALTDITREVVQRNLEKERAIRDNMTGFYNRNALSEVAGKALAECMDGEMVAFVYIGLTGYQEFQERFGMIAGNSYIRACSEMLRTFLTPRLIPFRWLGADFLVLVTGVKSPEWFRQQAVEIIGKIQKYSGEVEGIPVTFPVAVGYSLSGIDGDMPADLLEYASFAEHEVLRGERENPNPFNRERYEEAKRASLRRTFIKDIIDKNQLTVVFQPIVSLKTGELYGFEALSRPTSPMYKSIEELIADAEATGHYPILEKRMIYNALDAYMTRDERFRDQYLFINTAPSATLDEQDYNDIRDRYFGHMKVVFEVVERNRMDPEEINMMKSTVIKTGAKFALDDFGSGYSNHLALLALEPDIIKIDKELVRGIFADFRKQHMVEDIISYARYRGTKVLAEGVETGEELETLCRLGADYAQGYFIGEPKRELSEPSDRALVIIRSMERSNVIGLGSFLAIVKESMALADPRMAQNAVITAYLIKKMALRLKMKGERLAGLIVAAALHDMGALAGGDGDWRNETGREVPDHSLFAYLIMKEYFPYEQCAEAVLYHHLPWSQREAAVENAQIPGEAYLLSLADSAARLVLENPALCSDVEKLVEKLRMMDHDPRNVSLFAELCRAGILREIASGEYLGDLINFSGRLQTRKSEIEGFIRTYVYSVVFRMPETYAHARIMEITARFLARLTKQSWKLVETIGLAALMYNLCRLAIPQDEMKTAVNAYEENLLARKKLKALARIMEKAGLDDIGNLMNAASGEEACESRFLMVKDIVMGSRILNIADIFANLLEDRPGKPALNCVEAVYKLANLVRDESGYLPIVETMQDYVDDIEGRVQTAKSEIEKRYRGIMDAYGRLSGGTDP